jgi:hypothetical protein
MRCFARNTLTGFVTVVISITTLCGQFAPVARLDGTTAIPGDSSCFVEWASGCNVQRGYMNIADTSLGYASFGNDTDALGPAGTNGSVSANGVVSLGDGGVATLTFAHPIYNGEGFDFAVFENGFMSNDSNLAFLELGFVEVSSDGIHFFRFPSISHVEDTVQTGAFASTDGGQLYDLAGKYIAGYGTPFDLEELADEPELDINNITYIRVIDVVGSVDSAYATYDSQGNIVNDPWPTPFASCGFDLDAVGVIHAKMPSAIAGISAINASIFPNPVSRGNPVFVESGETLSNLEVYDLSGQLMSGLNIKALQTGNGSCRFALSTNGLSAGVYIISGTTTTTHFNAKFVVE